MDAAQVPILPRGVRLHFDRVRDKWVLLAPERAVTLDAVGHAILSEVDGTRSFGEITKTLADRYSAPLEQIVGDIPEDVQTLAPDALAHRMVMSWRAVAEGRTTRDVIADVLGAVAPL